MSLVHGVILWFLIGAPTDEPLGFPFARFNAAAEAKVAARFRRRLEKGNGVGRALRSICTVDGANDEGFRKRVEDLVAKDFLLEHGDTSFPLLLDTVRRGARNDAAEVDTACGEEATALVKVGLCSGYATGGTGREMDAHPLAIARRVVARRALAAALTAGGPRSDVALEILLEDSGDCPGLAETVHDATASLVSRLGVPKPGMRIPRSPTGNNESWELALRALALEGADRTVAETPVAAFLDADSTAPLAALALARMGIDVGRVIPRLARLVETIDVRDQDQLTQLGDIADALTLTGTPANSALPNLAVLLRRQDAPGCHSLAIRRYVDLVRNIATPGDRDAAAAALVPLVECDRIGLYTPIEDTLLQALAELGSAGRDGLISVLRDDRRMIRQRLAAAERVDKGKESRLEDRDRQLLAVLRRKRAAHPPAPQTTQERPFVPELELAACRAEAGMTPLALPVVETDATTPKDSTTRLDGGHAFAVCLSRYLCGPARETYEQTMGRCCRVVENTGIIVPSCRGLRDPLEAKRGRQIDGRSN